MNKRFVHVFNLGKHAVTSQKTYFRNSNRSISAEVWKPICDKSHSNASAVRILSSVLILFIIVDLYLSLMLSNTLPEVNFLIIVD